MGATFRRCPSWLRSRGAQNAVEACGMPMTTDGSAIWFDCQICAGSGWIEVPPFCDGAKERWGGAKWTPDQVRYWLPILTETGIDGAIERLWELAQAMAERYVARYPDSQAALSYEEIPPILRALLRAAIQRGSALGTV
jgi:hypothetical protein